jgi:hypothetical protein
MLNLKITAIILEGIVLKKTFNEAKKNLKMYLIIFSFIIINLGDIALEQGNLKMPCTTFKK